jgi:hypothetical protein
MGNTGKFGCVDILVLPRLIVLGRVPSAEDPPDPAPAPVQNSNTSALMQDVRNRLLP